MTASHFHPTQWTLVLRARGESSEAKAALSDLCAAYYEPVVAFLRRDGRGDDAAREKAHAFFESVLSQGVGAPDRERGRFRSYLLGSLKHFLSNHREASLAMKRGGGVEHVSFLNEDVASGTHDETLAFDRDWALSLIARALASLEADLAGKPQLFAVLKPWLATGVTGSQADAARALGISEAAVKVAIHRLRVRFRELIRAEVAATVNDPAEVPDELRHLISVASAE